MHQFFTFTGNSVTKLISLTVFLALFLVAGSAMAQTPFSSLEERMSFEDFRNSGLEKLSPEELTHLNSWIRGHSLGGEEGGLLTAASGPREYPSGFNPGRIGFTDYRGEPVPIVARIKGDFDGWRGKTVFELDNGMVWRQVEQDILGIRSRSNPQVTIEPGLFGSWYLKLEGVNRRIQVKRVEVEAE